MYAILQRSDEDLGEATMEAVQYLVAECNYGGRITDTHDRRLLATLLGKLVSLKVASEDKSELAETAGLYSVPRDLERESIKQQVYMMDVVPFPQGLGLSNNSAMVRDLRDSKALLKGVLLTQPGIGEEVIFFHNILICFLSGSHKKRIILLS